jgi:heme A synthase
MDAATSETTALRGPFRLAVAMVVVTIVLILFGAMVTSTGSGLAAYDWPLFDGQLLPARALTELPAFFEYFHRVIASAVGLMMLSLTIWVGVVAEGRPDLRWLCITGLALVGAQGVIGGTGVLYNLPAVNSVTHGILAQLTLATFAVIALAMTPAWTATVPASAERLRSARRLTTIALCALLLQLTLGAIARHTGKDEALWSHVGFAFVVFLILLVTTGWIAGRLGALPGLARLTRILTWLLLLQIVLGFVVLIVRTGKDPRNIQFLWRCTLISTHVLIGALLMLTTSQLCARSWRLRPAGTGGPGA